MTEEEEKYYLSCLNKTSEQLFNFFEEHPKKQQKIIASNIEKTIFFIASPSMISLLSYTETFQKRPKKG